MQEEPVEQRDLSSAERGADLSRIGAFSDGVFAIAITLLILQLDIPAGIESGSGLFGAFGDQTADFFAFAISFAVTGRFWYLHHRFMQTIQEFDPRLIALNMGYLFFVVLIPFTSELMGEYGPEIPVAVMIYIANIALVTVMAGFMYVHSLRHGLLRPEFRELGELGVKAVFTIAAIMAATIPLALLLGPYTPLTWLLLLRLNPYDRARRKATAPEAGDPPGPGVDRDPPAGD